MLISMPERREEISAVLTNQWTDQGGCVGLSGRGPPITLVMRLVSGACVLDACANKSTALSLARCGAGQARISWSIRPDMSAVILRASISGKTWLDQCAAIRRYYDQHRVDVAPQPETVELRCSAR
jgi:hypothetical protein